MVLCTGFCIFNLLPAKTNTVYHIFVLGYLAIGVRKILKQILEKWHVTIQTGMNCLRIITTIWVSLEAQISSPNEWTSTLQESCITVILVTQISTPTKLKFHIQIK